jgi:hypothetical protein
MEATMIEGVYNYKPQSIIGLDPTKEVTICAYLEKQIDIFIAKNPGKRFQLINLVGKKWVAPFNELYLRNLIIKSHEDAHSQAALDGGTLLKNVVHRHKKRFRLDKKAVNKSSKKITVNGYTPL